MIHSRDVIFDESTMDAEVNEPKMYSLFKLRQMKIMEIKKKRMMMTTTKSFHLPGVQNEFEDVLTIMENGHT